FQYLYFLEDPDAGLPPGDLSRDCPGFRQSTGRIWSTSMLIGYVPGKTSTISTTVYQFWRTNNEQEAFLWVIVNVVISTVILLAVNMLERRNRKAGGRR